MAQERKEVKPKWVELIDITENMCNGKCIFLFQDGVPVKIEEIRGEKRDIVLKDENVVKD